ncbi:hypothetical protein K466DRAFT_598055 [Polyporus arcularius HHB13444]|uniref:Uncharacterized protein n=1 Tax=Polyporus arcularius HHB13444 TaxID=1314778 RepID=A0A5C3PJ60_9APHY|nr:hypothetical protein K466DRAFT_598055 [Polyporus arcularius HHB13444]
MTCALFSTPFGIPFFGWTGDGYRKLTMEELRPQYETWESQQAALRKHAQTLVREADEARIEEELFKEDEDEGDVQCLEYLTVEDSVPEIICDTAPLTVADVDTSSFSKKEPSKFIVIVQDVEAVSDFIHDKLDICEAVVVTEEEVSEDVVLKVNGATNTHPQYSLISFIGAHFLKRIFGNRCSAGTHDVVAAEELEDEREVEEWLFVKVEEDDDEVVAPQCKGKPKQRRRSRVNNVKRRSLASIGNNMKR